jgi:transcriptional regulator with XRE-family HTH domain
MTLGKRLRDLRETGKFSVYDMEKSIGVSASYIAQIERGERRPSVRTLNALASFFGVTADYLITGEVKEAADPEWTPERRAILEELKRDDMTSTMFRSVMEGRRMNEIPDEDLLTIVKLIEFLREKNRKGGAR